MPHLGDQYRVDEQPHDDRGCAQQDIVNEAHGRSELGVAPVLRQVRPGENPNGRTDHHAERGHHQAADDRVQQTAVATGRRRHFGEDGDAQAAQSLEYERAQDDHQHADPEHGRAPTERHDHNAAQATALVAALIDSHDYLPAFISRRISISRAMARTIKVIMKRMSPSATKEAVCRSPTASVNSLAMVADMVVPGARIEAEIRCALPMTNVTAMVSP